MELTGKCQLDFEKWFEQSEYRKHFQLTGIMSDTPFVCQVLGVQTNTFK